MKNARILFIDDETAFLDTIIKRMKKRGFNNLKRASSGSDGLAILEKEPIDVIVSDIRMPGMDGIDVLGEVKRRYPKTEVILLTGHATSQDGVLGIKEGAFDYLSKPIELDHLLSKIRQAFDKILRDEEKKRETEFRINMEQQMIATKRLASLGTLAAGVAHEINNPLAIINESTGWMELILGKKELADMPRKADFKMALGKINNAVERARIITHQLLGIVRKDNAVLSEVNVRDFLDEIIQMAGVEIKSKDIKIIKYIDDTLTTVWIDPHQVRQILINLVTNAVHATPGEGKIFIAIEDSGEDILFIIKDTGEGIPKENLEKIFEPFFTTKSPGNGTGLGLFIIKGIIEKLGGEIDVDSRIGVGTTFCITFPKQLNLKMNL
ncbi:MAG TPA: hybrid sensor histidine kinase/response regulator [Desulfobacteraceae bacterium]|nr:hybrid sensor histidine kinase/response regulator [Desulfobacteraceae bacterium]